MTRCLLSLLLRGRRGIGDALGVVGAACGGSRLLRRGCGHLQVSEREGRSEEGCGGHKRLEWQLLELL
jgi:hypothetical protein